MTAIVRPCHHDPRVLTKAFLAFEGLVILAVTTLSEAAQTVLLFTAAATAIGAILRLVWKIVSRTAKAAENLEHLPEVIAHIGETRSIAEEARRLAHANGNALAALLRELGIEARALRKHVQQDRRADVEHDHDVALAADLLAEAQAEAQRRRDERGDRPILP